MIKQIFLTKLFKTVGRHTYLFSSAKKDNIEETYSEKKKRRQIQKKDLAYQHQDSLEILDLNMKQLVPNFFTSRLPLHFSNCVKTADETTNFINNSFVQLDIPIKTKPQLKLSNVLRRFDSNSVRIGRIMEIMDSVAGIVGYKHCFGSFNINNPNPFVLVTGCVDSINFFQNIHTEQDIRFQGNLNYAGNTSMEIEISIYQEKRLKANALFAMISRDASNHSKSYPCPKLSVENLQKQQKIKAQKRHQLAKINIQRRKKQMTQSYSRKPPNQQDSALLHKLYLDQKKIFNRKSNNCAIQATKVTNTLLMHLQQRNVHNKIFGGFLMREMLETAWVVGDHFLEGNNFEVEDITNIYFTAPVEIGTQLRITGKITYSKKNIVVVSVQAQTYNSETKQQKLCCHLNVFIKSLNNKQYSGFYPLTYENGILYLSGKNAFQEVFK